ncbi:MAG: YdcF family protein [Bacteroidales bacterium]|nr:YdcF family protein [Bacteroidales bacterium]
MRSILSKIVTIVLSLFSVILILNSCAYSSRASRVLLEKSMTKKFDVVVVPGVPFDNGKWSRTMKDRVLWSKFLYDKGITYNIMYSGSAVYTPYYEAEIMALYAEKIGIPRENIYTETMAKHSTENVYYSFRKARKLGFEQIALASDPFQTKMLKRYTKKVVSPDVSLIPIIYDTLQVMESRIPDPEIDYRKAFVTDFTSLTENESFFKRFKGTRGFDIDTSAYQ